MLSWLSWSGSSARLMQHARTSTGARAGSRCGARQAAAMINRRTMQNITATDSLSYASRTDMQMMGTRCASPLRKSIL